MLFPAVPLRVRRPSFIRDAGGPLRAFAGLLCGWGLMVVAMMFWNYLVAPIYMGYPREAVVKLLLPAFLPFNLLKGGLNTAITMLIYRPVITALRRCHLIEADENL